MNLGPRLYWPQQERAKQGKDYHSKSEGWNGLAGMRIGKLHSWHWTSQAKYFPAPCPLSLTTAKNGTKALIQTFHLVWELCLVASCWRKDVVSFIISEKGTDKKVILLYLLLPCNPTFWTANICKQVV